MTSEKKENILIYGVLAFCTLVFISLCFDRNVWLDEAFTATLVHTDFSGVLNRSMADTLPPLYNILLWVSTNIFGYSVQVMKLTSVLPMFLTLLLGATVLRKRFGVKTSVLFMIFVTGMPLMFYFGIEIRMYSLGFFFATATGIYAYEIICDFNKKNCILFAVMAVLAGYSHHFAFVAAGFVYGVLLLYYIFFNLKNIRQWFICLAITVILYIPCGIITLKQLKSVSGYFSMPDVDLHLFIQYAVYPFTCGFTPVSLLLLFLSAFVIGYSVYMLLKDGSDKIEVLYFLGCFAIFYGVLIFGTVISKIMTANIFVDRYLFFSAGLIWLALSVLIPRVKISHFEIIAAVITAAAFITTYTVQYRLEYGNSASEEISFIEDNFSGNDVLYTVEDIEEFKFCIPFYSIISGKGETKYTDSLSDAVSRIKDGSSDNLWIVVKDGCDISDDDLKLIEDSGGTLKDMASFDFDRYKCEMYKVEF